MQYKGPINDGITQSLLASFIDCPRRAYNTLCGYESNTKKPSLQFGTLMHWLLEKTNTFIMRKKRIPKLNFKVLKAQYKKKHREEIIDLQKFEFNFCVAECLLQGYLKHWGKKDVQKKWIKAESKFDCKLGNFRLRGMRDALYKTKQGKLWLQETKTSSGISAEAFESKLNFDFQSLFYAVATELERTERVAGVLYNIIFKPTIRLKKDETLEDYKNRLTDSIKTDPDKYFLRYEIVFTKKRTEEFVADLKEKLTIFNTWYNEYKNRELDTWLKKPYKNESACIKRWNCEFLKACSSGDFSGYNKTKKLFSELE